MSSGTEDRLTALLKRLTGDKELVQTDDLRLLAGSLVPTATRNDRNIAFVCLSKALQAGSSAVSSDAQENTVFRALRPIYDEWSADHEPPGLIPGTALLGAITPLAPKLAGRILTTPLATLLDSADGAKGGKSPSAIDVLELLLESCELSSPLQPVFAELLSQAAGHKATRELVRSRAYEWLQGALDYGTSELGALCASALSKLSRAEGGAVPDVSESGQEGTGRPPVDETRIAEKMMDLISSGPSNPTAALSALEGLSILSTKPAIKQRLAASPTFMRNLLELAPATAPRGGSLPVTPRGSMSDLTPLLEPAETSVCYGVALILSNVTAKRPNLSAEDEQIAKLRAMAISGKEGPQDDTNRNPLDDDNEVRKRVKLVLRAGAVSALSGLARAESMRVKEELGRVCLNLVDNPADRMGFVRDGGFKVLSTVVRDLVSAATSLLRSDGSAAPAGANDQRPGVAVLPALQALAKMVITTPPQLLFPPPHMTTCLNSLTPLYHLLVHPKAGLLQAFEALMALTNLASLDPSIGDRILEAAVVPIGQDEMWRGSGREDKVSIEAKVRELMLDDNTLVRRAATELVCNLVSSGKGFARWTGEDGIASTAVTRSKLEILLAMTDVVDMQTRLAASGALAVLAESPSAAGILLSDSRSVRASAAGDGSTSPLPGRKSTWAKVLALLEAEEMEDEVDGERIALISTRPADPGLQHRAVVILLDLVTFVQSDPDKVRKAECMRQIKDARAKERLSFMIDGGVSPEVLEPATYCLNLIDSLK